MLCLRFKEFLVVRHGLGRNLNYSRLMSGEILGHTQLRCSCFQSNWLRCWYLFFGFSSIIEVCFINSSRDWLVIFLKSWTWTSYYFSDSTGGHKHSPIHFVSNQSSPVVKVMEFWLWHVPNLEEGGREGIIIYKLTFHMSIYIQRTNMTPYKFVVNLFEWPRVD